MAQPPDSFAYAVLRVVPDIEREEFLNAGLILFCRPRRYLEARTELDEAALGARRYPPPSGRRERAVPDFAHLYRELKRRGATLELLWQEYRQQHGEQGYGYSRFCDLYRT